MDRRATVCLLAAVSATVPSRLLAATPKSMRRIGILCPTWEDLSSFTAALAARGIEQTRGAEIIFKRADTPEGLFNQARALAELPVDVIAASSTVETLAAKQATLAVPIVMIYGVAPVELGLVESLARPGGNVTGTAAVPIELVAKTVEIFRQALPRLRRLAVLLDRGPWAATFLRETARATSALQIDAHPVTLGAAPDLGAAFAEIERWRADGLLVIHGLVPLLPQLIDYAASKRIPAIYSMAPAVPAGGLMAYAPNLRVVHMSTAAIVERLLNGARPQDIPVEQPTRFVLAINRGTARAIGLNLPASLLVRADLVVD